MGDRPNRTYSDLVALLVAAVIMLIMISITEAAVRHEQLMKIPGNPWTDHIRALDVVHGIPYAGSIARKR